MADSGTYALIGAASVLGGMSRMTISGTVILLEACGNASYLLPLMLTFITARYVGNQYNSSLYDTQLQLRHYPFLDSDLPTIGLINYEEVSKIMASPVVTLREIESVRNVFDALRKTSHSGFPVTNGGRLTGFMLRKTLCSLLKLRAFSSYVNANSGNSHQLDLDAINNTVLASSSSSSSSSSHPVLQSSATIFYDTLERGEVAYEASLFPSFQTQAYLFGLIGYPHYPTIDSIQLLPEDKVRQTLAFFIFSLRSSL